jgi:hypothetical protein
MLAVGILLMLVVGFMGIAKAQGEEYIVARIYNSDGTFVGNVSGSGKVLVIDKDTGETEIEDTVTISNGYIVHAVSEDAIDAGDRVRIWVDGSGWGDADYYAHVLGSPDDIDFEYGGIPGDSFEAQTYKDIPLNLKPIIALIFIILILLFGFLFLATMNRQKLNVAVTGKKKVKLQTKQGLRETWEYACSYGEKDDLTELGKFNDDNDYAESALIKVSVRKIVKDPDGVYQWYNPKAVDMSKMSQDELPKKPDLEEKIDKKWFQGGALKLEKGQSMQNASRAQTHRLFVGLVYPFLVLELIFGVGSIFYESLRFPPSIWILLINILILVFAMIFQIMSYSKATKEEKPPQGEAGESPEKLESWTPVKPEVSEEPVETEEMPGEGEAQAEEEAPAEAEATEEAPKTEEEGAAKAGEEAPADAPAEGAEKPAEAPGEGGGEMMGCPNCGQEISTDFVICPFCGKNLR